MKLALLALASVACLSFASFLDRRAAKRRVQLQPPPAPVDDGDPRLTCHEVDGGYACTRREF